MTSERFWMTPVEFQAFSGCTGADWRHAIKLADPACYKDIVRAPRRTQLSIKALIDNKSLQVHSTTCKCEKCQENNILQVDLTCSFDLIYLS